MYSDAETWGPLGNLIEAACAVAVAVVIPIVSSTARRTCTGRGWPARRGLRQTINNRSRTADTRNSTHELVPNQTWSVRKDEATSRLLESRILEDRLGETAGSNQSRHYLENLRNRDSPFDHNDCAEKHGA
jgi:hypothetical protein